METVIDPLCRRRNDRGKVTASFEGWRPGCENLGGAGFGSGKVLGALLISVLFHGALLSAPFPVNRTWQPRCEEVQLFIARGGGAPAETVHPGEFPERRVVETVQDPEPSPREPILAERVIPKPPQVKPVEKKPVARANPTKPVPRAVEKPVESETPTPNAGQGTCEAQGQAQASTVPGPVGQGSATHGPVESTFGAHDGPRFLRKVLPRYPQLAREMGKEGTVILRLTLDERGRLLEVVVVRSAGSDFDEQALRAVKESTFSPAKRDGRPVMCRANLPVKFVLEGSDHD